MLIRFSHDRLHGIIDGMKGRRIAVVGDLMLDRYIWGSVTRISPEAPVPVIDMDTEQMRLGGAANVAKNIKSLGGEPLLLGVIGADNSGKQLSGIIRESGFSTDGVISDPSRPTTVKTRVIAHSQHVVRIDRETKAEIATPVVEQILDVLRSNLSHIDGIIIEDYNKGVVIRDLIVRLIAMANEAGITITVDPKFNNFFNYRNVTLFKPNRKEAEEALGIRIRSRDDVITAGRTLLDKLQPKNVLLTLGEEGMSLFETSGSVTHFPTKARNVADVSGAGDTVIATLTMSLAAGATLQESSVLANFAGGIVCGYVGIVPIDPEILVREILQDNDHHSQGNA